MYYATNAKTEKYNIVSFVLAAAKKACWSYEDIVTTQKIEEKSNI